MRLRNLTNSLVGFRKISGLANNQEIIHPMSSRITVKIRGYWGYYSGELFEISRSVQCHQIFRWKIRRNEANLPADRMCERAKKKGAYMCVGSVIRFEPTLTCIRTYRQIYLCGCDEDRRNYKQKKVNNLQAFSCLVTFFMSTVDGLLQGLVFIVTFNCTECVLFFCWLSVVRTIR